MAWQLSTPRPSRHGHGVVPGFGRVSSRAGGTANRTEVVRASGGWFLRRPGEHPPEPQRKLGRVEQRASEYSRPDGPRERGMRWTRCSAVQNKGFAGRMSLRSRTRNVMDACPCRPGRDLRWTPVSVVAGAPCPGNVARAVCYATDPIGVSRITHLPRSGLVWGAPRAIGARPTQLISESSTWLRGARGALQTSLGTGSVVESSTWLRGARGAPQTSQGTSSAVESSTWLRGARGAPNKPWHQFSASSTLYTTTAK
ncbi:MAG: hypothetical protein ACI9BV_000226 [Rhodothermales bacterium]|jgi:hypothetical protein